MVIYNAQKMDKQDRNEWGLPEWENVIKHKGRIDPKTIAYAKEVLEELRRSEGICCGEREE